MSTNTSSSPATLTQAEAANIKPIRNLKELWQAVMLCLANGDYDTDAMYPVYKAMNPKLTLQDLANVFSGVYADTYWAINYMNPALLSKSMQQALTISPASADVYAANAIAQWRGVLCRKNYNDTGIIPVQGSYTESPDIVCNENTPLQLDQLINQWTSQFWQKPVVGKNYIYLRGQNVGFNGGITAPKVQLFYTAGGFNQPPQSWIQCQTVDGNNNTGSLNSEVNGVVKEVSDKNPLSQDERSVSEAFYFSPVSTDHVCVIGIISTEFFSNPLPNNGNWNLQQWITSNGAAAWHNYDPQQQLEDTLVFHNQDASPEDFYFVARCRNVPKGTKIQLRNQDGAAAFDTGVIVVDNPSQEIRQAVTLPANYQGKLTVRLESADGSKLAANAAVELIMLWRLPADHAHYADAAQQLRAYKAEPELTLDLGRFTITGSPQRSR